jgi:effector-binding domain-containing protein
MEKVEAEKKIEAKEMKSDLSDELLGQVMDRMDDNYSSKDIYFSQPDPVLYSSAPKEEKDFDDDSEPETIPEEEVELDDELFENDELDEDEDVPL